MSDKGTEHGSLGEMYSDYFLDYASYVIMERAVPHLGDGLKPVQRRILHAMRQMEDGRYNKVANIVGDTMKYHPHGNVAIEDALVGMGQKDLLIDTQGNWGNILTGDPSAAGRYIEARLTPFALEVAFNPKTTEWTRSYDGRNREPVTLPMKFPLLLAQGGEGIAVGLACKILPHNFNELIEQCIRALRKKKVEIVPDFPTGGLMDASEYNDGLRGGRVRVRAKIEVVKKNVLRVVEIPWGTTTTSLQASIVAAQEKGKIKISRIEDNTAEEADILIHLSSGSDPESVRDALFAFTDCEISISPNSCVIADGKPQFLGVSEILKRSALQTKELLKQELEIRMGELEEKWHFSSLEKIFIEKRIYRDIEECETWDSVLEAIEKGLKPYKKRFRRAITREDIIRLTEIRIKRISKYDSFRANEEIKGLEDGIEETGRNLRNLTRYAVRYYQDLQKKYGKGREPRTDEAEFERVDRTQVVAATETLYVDEKNGFAGLGLKREKALEKCSRLDDVIAISQDAKMRVVRISDKAFVGKRPVHVAVFRRTEEKIYSMIYREGRDGPVLAKRFRAGGVTRDKIYELGKDTPGTRVIYFAVHDTEDESSSNAVVIHLKPVLRLR
ncbi:MAG: DNA gyrase/topoisomerase IV subunit A, partial [Verrucomicrobiota bacterium]|nr:DNA gyrase/topoisomerase IV subunit A [Verrucomicrobiota bacterium]